MHLLYAVVMITCLGTPVLGAAVYIDLPWECRSPDLDCDDINGGTCQATGVCDCSGHSAGFTGSEHGCTIPAPLTACTSGLLTCLNGGTCLETGGAEVCFCTLAWSGADCSTPRVKAVCDLNSMTVTITPHGSFTKGIMYVHGQTYGGGTGVCDLTAGTPYVVTYAAGICGISLTPVIGPPDYYIAKFVIQFDSKLRSDADEVLEVQCEMTPTTPYIASVILLDVDPVDIDTERVTYTGNFLPEDGIELTLESEAVAVGDGDTVKFGKGLKFIILQTTGGFDHIKWLTLTITDGTTGGSSMRVLDDGCVHLDAKSVFESAVADVTTDPAVPTLTVEIRIFTFTTTTQLQANLELTLCDTYDADCDQNLCVDPAVFLDRRDKQFGTRNPSRRRRAAGDESDSGSKSGTISVNLNVQTPSDDLKAIKDKLDREGTTTSCMRSIVFLIPMILLALMLLISMAMTLYFCLKVTRRCDKDDREFGPAVNMGYKA